MIRNAEPCPHGNPVDDRCPPTRGKVENATQNACKLCAPLGAALAFAGVEGCISILHGSQGCATYIRRYLISHFREPMDIASSSFGEQEAVFGGARNLMAGIDNLTESYSPEVVGVATTCLAETIGEDVPQILRDYRKERSGESGLPYLIHVSTPSYTGDHWEGFHRTVRAIAEQTDAMGCPEGLMPEDAPVALLPGMLSCEDLRLLKNTLEAFELPFVMLPDYAATLDGGSWSEYQRIPKGGTSLGAIRHALSNPRVVALGGISRALAEGPVAHFEAKSANCKALPLPMGIRATDRWVESLSELAKTPVPHALVAARARLVDALVDGHKYLAGARAVVFADPDLLEGMVSLLSETGIKVVAAATGTKGDWVRKTLNQSFEGHRSTREVPVHVGCDHAVIADLCRELKPDLLLGNSKGYPIARELGIPLVRFGMPIHDRIGAQRTLHLGYEGAQRFYDQVVNALLQHWQDAGETGFSYL
jgi:nitrogenase molybdenum-iron protein NifN